MIIGLSKKSNHWLFNNNDSNLFRLDYPSLKGNIQLNNCATAIQTLTLLREITLNEKTINEAIKKTKILGRFDEINFAGKKVILDIAHNPQSVSFLKENLKKYYPNSEFIAVFSALEDKNVCSMIEELNGTINQWNISEINNERKTDIQDIEIALKRAKQKYKTYKNVTQSFNNAISYTDAKSVVVVFGSFYMVEEIYKYLDYKKMKDLIVKRLVGLVFFLLLFIIFLPALFKAEGVKDIQKISFGKPSEIIIKNKDMLKQSEDLVNLKENNEFSSTEKIIDINKITQAKSEFKAWIVRVGSFKVLDNAKKLNEKLQKKNFSSYIVKKEKNSEFFYYVNVGPFNKSKDIENIYLSLSKIKELKGIYIIEKNIK